MTPDDAETQGETWSLPMAADSARNEGRYLIETAKRVDEILRSVGAAAVAAQERIRQTQRYIQELDRTHAIDHGCAKEILRRLMRPEEM